jgi:hypothetical protein
MIRTSNKASSKQVRMRGIACPPFHGAN